MRAAFAPSLKKGNEEPLQLIEEAVKKAGYKFGKDVFVALDPAVSEMFDKATGKYKFFKSDPSKMVTSDEMIDMWAGRCKKYPIRSIEDGPGRRRLGRLGQAYPEARPEGPTRR